MWDRSQSTMDQKFSPKEEGKNVVTADGEQIGTVEHVEDTRAHVKPSHDLNDSTRQRLGWTDMSGETYELESDNVENFDDEQITLKD